MDLQQVKLPSGHTFGSAGPVGMVASADILDGVTAYLGKIAIGLSQTAAILGASHEPETVISSPRLDACFTGARNAWANMSAAERAAARRASTEWPWEAE